MTKRHVWEQLPKATVNAFDGLDIIVNNIVNNASTTYTKRPLGPGSGRRIEQAHQRLLELHLP